MTMFCSTLQFSCCDQTEESKKQQGKRHLQFLEVSFQKLSEKEKDLLVRDIYGKEDVIEETDEFVNGKLEDLKMELNLLSENVKSAYTQAIDIQNQQGEDEYVTSRKFLLMFLRADRFDARLAARRLTVHFKEKLALFGKDKLARRIKEEDLNEQDKDALYSGRYSSTGATDQTGRLIGFLHSHARMLDMNMTNLRRAVFYMMCNGIELDEIAQKRGVVVIAYNVGPWTVRQASKLRKILPLARMCNRALPFRMCGFHHCYSNSLYHLFLQTAIVVQPKGVRDRIQCHYGTHEECMAHLMTYGINPDETPYQEDGELRHEMIKDYLEYLRNNV